MYCIHGKSRKYFCVECGMVQAQESKKRDKRNANRRAKNQILRDICGTSAAAARRDMGI